MLLAQTLLAATCVCLADVVHSNTLSVKFLGFDVVNPAQVTVDVDPDEISGVVWFRNTIDSSANGGNVFYGISDDLESNKGWMKYEYNSATYEMSIFGGTVLGDNPYEDPQNMDSESIAILGLPYVDLVDDSTSNTPTNELQDDLYAYMVIATEGYRKHDTGLRIMLYSFDGSYIKEFDYPSQYNITKTSGVQDNGAFEALDISADYQTIVYCNEQELLQDDCTDCRRITVSSFDVPDSTNATASDVTMTNDHMLRYNVVGDDWRVVDMVLLDADTVSNCSGSAYTLPALVMEHYNRYWSYNFRIFLIDVALGDNDDVLDCFSFGSDCPDASAMNKILVYDMKNDTALGNTTVGFSTINFESIAVYDDSSDSSDDLDSCTARLIMASDNGGDGLNYWLSYQISYSNSDSNSNSQEDDSANLVGNGVTKIVWFILCLTLLSLLR